MDAIIESLLLVFITIVEADDEEFCNITVRKVLSSSRYSNFIQKNGPKGIYFVSITGQTHQFGSSSEV